VVGATFTSNDANYSDAAGTGAMTINKASSTTVVSVANAAFDGEAHGATATVTGVGDLNEAVNVTYTGRNGTSYAASSTGPTNAGDYIATATYAGDTNHNGSSDSKNFSIAKAAPTVSASGTFMYDGIAKQAIGSATGVNGAAVNGSYSFTYLLQGGGGTPSAIAPVNAGTYVVSVTFTSANANYSNASGTGSMTINKAGSITTVTIGDSTYDGTPRGGTAGVTGAGGLNQPVTLTYLGRNGTEYAASTSAPVNTGDYTATATFAGDANHSGSTASKDFTVSKATPVIDWANPAAITYGTALTGTQLNAVAKLGTVAVAGTYTYTPGAGTLLNAGQGQTLSVNFAPNDTRNFTTASKTVTVNVGQKPATITADNKTKQFSDPMPEYTATSGGLVGNDTLGGTVTTSTTATPMSPAGTYSLMLTGSGFNPNYAVTLINGTLTVTQEDATITYTGDTLVTASSNSNATVNLTAAVQEAQDGSLGNALAGKLVKFSIYKGNNVTMTTVDYSATGTIGAGNIAITSVSLPADDYTMKLEFVSNGYYTAPVEAAAFTVVNPTSGMTTGGGWLTDPNGRRANFGFTVRYVPSGNPQGNSNYIYRDMRDLSAYGAPAGVRDYDIIIKSNALSAMSLDKTVTPATGVFTGKNNVFAIDRLTGLSYNIAAGQGLQFEVDLTDAGNGAAGDTYALRVWNNTGTYKAVGGYTASGKNTGQVAIGGGNLQVK
jgi:hypothetical protein